MPAVRTSRMPDPRLFRRQVTPLGVVMFACLGSCAFGAGVVWSAALDAAAGAGLMVGGVLCLLGAAASLWGLRAAAPKRANEFGRRETDALAMRVRVASEGAGIGFWDRDLVTGDLSWDAAMHRIYGTDPRSTKPSSSLWAKMVHGDDIERTAELFEKAINGAGDFETTFRIVRPDGTVRSVRATATVVTDTEGRAVRVVGANWDVSDLKETEGELRSTATRLSLAMRAARIGLWDVQLTPGDDRLEMQRARCDGTLHRMLGYEPGELDTPNTGWHSICHPDDLEAMRARCRAALDDEAESYRWDYRVRAKTGDWVWVHDAGEVVERDATGRATRMVGVRMLIDEQRRTEEALRSAVSLRRTGEASAVLTELSRSIAEAFDAMFVSVALFREIDGARYGEVVGGWMNGASCGQMIYPLRGTPCELVSGDSACVYPNGVLEAFPEDPELAELGAESYAGVPIRGSDGTAIGVLNLIHDRPLREGFDYDALLALFAARASLEIEHLEVESRLRSAKEAAERASEFKSALVANVSHEIRTPLSAMIGYAGLLAEESDPGRAAVADFASTIERNGAHLLALVNDLLDSSKIGAGLMRIEKSETPIGEIASDVIELLGPRAVEKGVALEIRCDTPVPSEVVSDPARVRQILVNLIGNAIKFTEQGRVELGVGYENGVLRFTVRDTGIGIAPEAIPTLFEPFRQADASTSRRFGGTGLGLSISRDLAQLLGGDIEVESELGKGSTFTATLLAEPGPDAVMQDAAAFFDACTVAKALGVDVGPQRPALQGVSVMLIEDSVDNRRLLSFHLNRAGATVVTASDGREALELIWEGGSPDIIITDLQMPVLDGYTLVARLRGMAIRTPVLALSAHATREDEARCREVGCDAYETKPIPRERLVEVCLGLLGRSRETESGGGDGSVERAA